MKNIFKYATLALGVVAMTGCEDFLDQQSKSELNNETVFNSVGYTGFRVNKVYGLLGQDQTYSQVLSIVLPTNTDVELVDGLKAADVIANSERGAMNYNAAPGLWEKGQARPWTALYGIIEECNLNIEGIRGSDLISVGGSDQRAMERYLGECLALRAMCYLDLVRVFGDVPLKLESSKADLSNVNLTKTDRDIVLDSCLLNLEEAIALLPWADEVSGYTTEHVTRGYACALYAQVALTRAGFSIREKAKSGYETAAISDPVYPTQRPDEVSRKSYYEKALAKLSAIVESGKHSMNPSFENQWYLVNQCQLDQTYHENVFEIPMGLNVTGELGYTIGVRISGSTNYYGTKGNSSGKQKTTAMHLYSYDPADTRRDITCVAYDIRNKDGVDVEATVGNKPFELYIGKWDPRKMSDAWLSAARASSEKVMTGINCIRMRYSQVLLLYAEVLNELAGPDASYAGAASLTAREALKKVHLRAFNQADKANAEAWVDGIAASKEAFFDALVDEHAWELTGEGIRKYDLIRWGLLVSKINEMKQAYANDIVGNVPEKVYFNYLDEAKTKLDPASFTWYATPANTDAYDGSMTGFGGGDKNNYIENISCGLGGVEGATSPVINRHLLPLYTTVVADSNGQLKNSYGWED